MIDWEHFSNWFALEAAKCRFLIMCEAIVFNWYGKIVSLCWLKTLDYNNLNISNVIYSGLPFLWRNNRCNQIINYIIPNDIDWKTCHGHFRWRTGGIAELPSTSILSKQIQTRTMQNTSYMGFQIIKPTFLNVIILCQYDLRLLWGPMHGSTSCRNRSNEWSWWMMATGT